MAELPPVQRPNGKSYQPRKLVAEAVIDADEILSGVVVFGTHDPGRAQQMATDYVVWQLGTDYAAVDPVAVWWRSGYRNGAREWVDDEEHGRAAIWWREIVEAGNG